MSEIVAKLSTGDKINKTELYARVTERLRKQQPKKFDFPGAKVRIASELFSVSEVCNAFIDEIIEALSSGKRVSITGFGSFYVCIHKGHPVQFGGSSSKNVPDYKVCRFLPSNVLNNLIRHKKS